jgi:hypothetical protein
VERALATSDVAARARSDGARLAAAALVVASYLFRLPPLLNARSTNSDAAVVGLQAMHLLRGELSPFLWGSGYQTSADALAAAAFFAVLGPSPTALMLSALTLHVIGTWLVFATLRRRFDPWTALLLAMPLVVAPSSVHTYALYPPRQLSITLALAALSAIDRATLPTSRSARWLALGGLLFGLAVSADPYPAVLAPVVLGYGALVAWREARRLLPSLAIGVAAGLAPFVALHRMPRGQTGQMGLALGVAGHNWDLLVRECLPWALSYKVYYAHNVMDYRPWDAPAAVRVVQYAGAFAAFAIVCVGLGGAFMRRLSPAVRQLGLAGALTYPVALGAFLVSVMVMDHFSMRYLAVLTIMLPFAAMPAASLLGTRRFAIVIAPHLVASALCGWIGYGPFVRGPRPVRETPELRDDYVLFDLLRARGVGYAEADYWASYRLTFLSGERIVVVPTNAGEDRYPPYRRAFEDARVFAYVFDPGRSREDLREAEARLTATNAHVEGLRAGGHTVLLVTR